MPKKTNSPEIINISDENINAIQTRLTNNTLHDEDKKIICAVLSTYQWISHQLQLAKFSIQKLKSIFGFKTEKKSVLRRKKSDSGTHFPSRTENTEQKPPKKP